MASNCLLAFCAMFVCLPLLFCNNDGTEPVDLNRCLPAENICDRIICLPLTEPCNGEILSEASVCGCCEECVEFIDDSESCLNIPHPPGGKPLKTCKAGSECNLDSGVCEQKIKQPICRAVENIILENKETINSNHQIDFPETIDFPENLEIRDDIWVPDCDNRGLFKPVQCKDKKCFCVDENGNRIFGQSELELSTNMTCACSVAVNKRRLREKEEFMTKAHERCTETGDYEELQCVDEICFCANTTTGKPISHMVRMDQIEFLSCYKPKTLKEPYLTICEKQVIRERTLNLEFSRKGITIKGSKTLNCDYDGTFAPRQCESQSCHCTHRKGGALKSYQLDKAGGNEMAMYCYCARDEFDRELNNARYPIWKCGQIGHFEPGQCLDDECWCLDEDGNKITTPSIYDTALSPICQELQRIFSMSNLLAFFEI